jgi:hypothetical protein
MTCGVSASAIGSSLSPHLLAPFYANIPRTALREIPRDAPETGNARQFLLARLLILLFGLVGLGLGAFLGVLVTHDRILS